MKWIVSYFNDYNKQVTSYRQQQQTTIDTTQPHHHTTNNHHNHHLPTKQTPTLKIPPHHILNLPKIFTPHHDKPPQKPPKNSSNTPHHHTSPNSVAVDGGNDLFEGRHPGGGEVAVLEEEPVTFLHRIVHQQLRTRPLRGLWGLKLWGFLGVWDFFKFKKNKMKIKTKIN